MIVEVIIRELENIPHSRGDPSVFCFAETPEYRLSRVRKMYEDTLEMYYYYFLILDILFRYFCLTGVLVTHTAWSTVGEKHKYVVC